ncbi:MAG: trehalose 2-sulfotransferase [Solirubrobacteraceae bacterium]|jgi:LPS sulfotransferase NodH|nr:trehalose 2-sulfotransferase [Solirubrobacteraceae bacterium]
MSGVWDPLREELDSAPPRDRGLPATSYVVCSTPRSGSGLLCRGLASSGLAGVPAEYFNANQRVPLAARWATGPSLRAYVAALRARRSSPDGVFGTKLHADQLEQLAAEAAGPAPAPSGPAPSAAFLERLLGDVRYVRIVRLDVDRQAISLWTALRTGVWSVREGAARVPRDEPPYSFEEIEGCRRTIVDGEVLWDRFMRCNAIVPLEVAYEELVASYAATVCAVLAAILGDAVDSGAVAPPDGVRQAGARAEELCARFAADRGRRGAAPALPAAGARSVLSASEALGVGDGMASPNAVHQLALAGDGRLVLHHRDDARWASPAGGDRGGSLLMQSDGDLVLLDGRGGRLWSAGTAGHPGARLELQDDGTLVVRSVADEPLWHAP